jgi:hypothetical protein
VNIKLIWRVILKTDKKWRFIFRETVLEKVGALLLSSTSLVNLVELELSIQDVSNMQKKTAHSTFVEIKVFRA